MDRRGFSLCSSLRQDTSCGMEGQPWELLWRAGWQCQRRTGLKDNLPESSVILKAMPKCFTSKNILVSCDHPTREKTIWNNQPPRSPVNFCFKQPSDNRNPWDTLVSGKLLVWMEVGTWATTYSQLRGYALNIGNTRQNSFWMENMMITHQL